MLLQDCIYLYQKINFNKKKTTKFICILQLNQWAFVPFYFPIFF